MREQLEKLAGEYAEVVYNPHGQARLRINGRVREVTEDGQLHLISNGSIFIPLDSIKNVEKSRIRYGIRND